MGKIQNLKMVKCVDKKYKEKKWEKIKVHIVNYHKNHRSLIADESSRGS